jgi:hypothetical protein
MGRVWGVATMGLSPDDLLSRGSAELESKSNRLEVLVPMGLFRKQM